MSRHSTVCTRVQLISDDSLRSLAARDELYGFIMAGFDSSSTTLSWIMKQLGKYPDAQGNIRQELHDKFSEEPTALALCKAELPYLDAFIEE